MKSGSFAERHPFVFSFALILLFFLISAAGVIAAQRRGLPASTFAVYSEIALAIALSAIVWRMGWWEKIGFRRPGGSRALLLYLPALILVAGNLTFGIHVTALPALLTFALLAALSGFVEELTFRGLMLTAFLPRGGWYAVIASSIIFGLAHAMNVLGGSNPLYVVIQIVYALAIGFGFGAMALRGRMLWPLMVAHALGNFVAFINTDSGQVTGGTVGPQLYIVSLVYILVFGGYGLYLMRRPAPPSIETVAEEM